MGNAMQRPSVIEEFKELRNVSVHCSYADRVIGPPWVHLVYNITELV